VFKMKDSPNFASTVGGADYARHQFALEITGNSQDIFYQNFMDVRGTDLMMCAPRGSEADSAGFTPIPTSFIAQPDIISACIVGIQGGWKGPDSGCLISVL